MSHDGCWTPPCSDAWRGGAQNHQPATEGDWDERRLRALQGGACSRSVAGLASPGMELLPAIHTGC